MPQTSSGPEGDRGASVPASGDVVLSHAATVMPARARIFGDAHSHAGSDSDDPENSIDNWLAIDADGLYVTVYSGKVELGTGVRTALAQIVAGARCAIRARHLGDGRHRANPRRGWNDREQDAPGRRDPTPADRGRGSKILLARAAVRYGVPVDELQTRDGVVSVRDDPAGPCRTPNWPPPPSVNQRPDRRCGRGPLSPPPSGGPSHGPISPPSSRAAKLHPRSPARRDAARPRAQTICADHERRRRGNRAAR